MSTSKSKNKKERKKINDDIALMWLNWSVIIINVTFQLLYINIYIYIYICHIIPNKWKKLQQIKEMRRL